jgi:hypothetical protein
MSGKHRHLPTDDRIRGHGIYQHQCLRCGKWIVWIAELPNRKGHWRVAF